MDANHKFEVLATVFYMTTGLLAPGKDDRSGVSEDMRQQVWDQWNKIHGETSRAWFVVLQTQIDETEEST